MREELKEYIQANGIKQNFIANQIGVSKSLLCKFLKGTRNLSDKNIAKLKQIIH